MLTLKRNPASWQLVLADLVLILFLVTAATLTRNEEAARADASVTQAVPAKGPGEVAPAQALYRAGVGPVSLAQWLEQQPLDPRAALTIVAQHKPGEESSAWSEARAMAATAQALGIRSRVIIRSGKSYEVHASLAFDQPES
ncbi:MAG: hypothetical protein AAF559_11565 [Pseudomonadota bacterium]